MNHIILQTKGLCKTYIVNKHQNNVLKNVDLTISEGEMVAVMEPSGSGISTLLYCVSGMDRVTAGQVFFNGRALMRRLGIDNVCGNDINEVSGGQLQRACICRRLMRLMNGEVYADIRDECFCITLVVKMA